MARQNKNPSALWLCICVCAAAACIWLLCVCEREVCMHFCRLQQVQKHQKTKWTRRSRSVFSHSFFQVGHTFTSNEVELHLFIRPFSFLFMHSLAARFCASIHFGQWLGFLHLRSTTNNLWFVVLLSLSLSCSQMHRSPLFSALLTGWLASSQKLFLSLCHCSSRFAGVTFIWTMKARRLVYWLQSFVRTIISAQQSHWSFFFSSLLLRQDSHAWMRDEKRCVL